MFKLWSKEKQVNNSKTKICSACSSRKSSGRCNSTSTTSSSSSIESISREGQKQIKMRLRETRTPDVTACSWLQLLTTGTSLMISFFFFHQLMNKTIFSFIYVINTESKYN